MTITDKLLSMAPSKLKAMSRDELAKTVRRIGKRINEAARRVEAVDPNAPAVQGLRDSGGYITARGKSKDELISEFRRAQTYRNAKTSTVTKYREVKQEILAKVLGAPEVKTTDSSGKPLSKRAIRAAKKARDEYIKKAALTPQDEKRLWDAYHRLEERNPAALMGDRYKGVIQMLHDRVMTNPNSRKGDLVRYIEKRLDEMYEQEQLEWAKLTGDGADIAEDAFQEVEQHGKKKAGKSDPWHMG